MSMDHLHGVKFDLQKPIYSHFPKEIGTTRAEIPVYTSQKLPSQWTLPTLFSTFPSIAAHEPTLATAPNGHVQSPEIENSETKCVL